jgi:hypothetical protein
MFFVTETEAAAIRTAFDRGGEFAAAVELRRLFPAIADNVAARACARIIAGWGPLQRSDELAPHAPSSHAAMMFIAAKRKLPSNSRATRSKHT